MGRIFVKTSMLLLFAVLVATVSCKKSSSSSNTSIKKFTFRACDVAPDLKLKTYTVDSIAGTIQNSDSISYTSNIHKVVPLITFAATPSEIRINDATWNQVDSIDATSPFKLTIVAANKKDVKDYMVTVNKHSVNPDSIIWNKLDHNLNEEFESAKVYYTENVYLLIGEILDKLYVFSSDDGVTWLSDASDLDMDVDIMSGYAPRGEILRDSVYLLGSSYDALYVFDSTDDKFKKLADLEDCLAVAILGEYKNELLILAKKNDKPVVLSYHGGAITEKTSTLPSSFPVDGGFSPVLVKYDASTTFNVESMFIVGGNDVHATDNGWYWSDVVKMPGSGYFTNVTQTSAAYYTRYLFAFGGVTKNETPKYMPLQVSIDNGFTWSAGARYQRLPDEFTPKYGISAVADRDNNLFVFGGFDESGNYVTDFYKGRARQVDFQK